MAFEKLQIVDVVQLRNGIFVVDFDECDHWIVDRRQSRVWIDGGQQFLCIFSLAFDERRIETVERLAVLERLAQIAKAIVNT